MAEESLIPNFEDTPLKKHKKFKALVLGRQHEDEIIKEHEAKKKEYSDALFDIMSKADVEKARCEQFTVNLSTSRRESVDHGQLRQEMLDAGLSLDRIEKMFKKATRISESSYVTIRGTK